MRRFLLVALLMVGCRPADTKRELVTVTIPPGASFSEVARVLADSGVIRSPRSFKVYASLTDQDRAIKAGVYEFARGSSSREVLEKLVRGKVKLIRFQTPEGLMLTELADLVQSRLGIPRDSFRAAARDSTLRDQLAIDAPTLEGYLYPSTYLVETNISARDLVRLMVQEFEKHWKPEWDERARELGFSRHQIVILASIIEGEVLYDPDRRYVSSVYHNRLKRRMRLQADPTVIYALGRRRRLFQKDYRFPSSYNTYLHRGLPPGPIGQPSQASIEAALYPAETDFLYFVAGKDGRHVFSRTHAEHLRAIRRIRRAG